MAIPFRDLREEDGLGLAGYLRFVTEEDGRGIQGALFLINARGEPIEFAFSRIDVPASFLWRPGEARRRAIASLAATLFEACPKVPDLLLALAAEVHPRLFTEDLLVQVHVCRLADAEGAPQALGETAEVLPGRLHLFWVSDPPGDEAPARLLLDALLAHQLLTEPFERAAGGLSEAFRD